MTDTDTDIAGSADELQFYNVDIIYSDSREAVLNVIGFELVEGRIYIFITENNRRVVIPLRDVRRIDIVEVSRS